MNAVLKLHEMTLSFADNDPGLKVLVMFEAPRQRKRDRVKNALVDSVSAPEPTGSPARA